MTKTYLMTWVEGQKRDGRSGTRGTTYSVSPKKLGCPPTKTGSAGAANDWWSKKQAELDERAQKTKPHQEDYEERPSPCGDRSRTVVQGTPARRTKPTSGEWTMCESMQPGCNTGFWTCRTIRPKIDRHDCPFFGISEGGQAVWSDRFTRHEPEVLREKTVGGWVSRWTERQRVAQIASDRYMKYQYCINYFRDWLGADREVTDIDSGINGGLLMTIYWDSSSRDKASSSYCKERLDTAKQFLQVAVRAGFDCTPEKYRQQQDLANQDREERAERAEGYYPSQDPAG